MDTLQLLSQQKTYWLRQLQKGNITQDAYDGILDRIEAKEVELTMSPFQTMEEMRLWRRNYINACLHAGLHPLSTIKDNVRTFELMNYGFTLCAYKDYQP